MLFAATRAPSGSNRQPFRFLVLRDGPGATEARRILGESFRSMWAAKREADGYDAGSGAEADTPKARMAATMQHFVDHVEDVPVVVLACYRRHRAPHPNEGASVYPACQNLLLAARALGYGGVLTIWHAAVEAEVAAALGIPDDVVIAAEVDDMAMLRLMARETNGVTLVPPVVVRDELESGALIERHRFPQIKESFYAITPSRRFPNPILRELMTKKK